MGFTTINGNILPYIIAEDGAVAVSRADGNFNREAIESIQKVVDLM
jgi:hypothetical protein